MKKLAVIIPGIGYHSEKPLLYYSAKLAEKNGYEIMAVTFHDFPKKIRGNEKKMEEAFSLAKKQMAEQMAKLDFSEYEKIVFVSKSIGTVAAAWYAKERKKKIQQIYFTPLPKTFDYIKDGQGIVFHGTNDPWADTLLIAGSAEEAGLLISLVEKANHSLETEDVLKNIDILKQTMEMVNTWL